MTTATAAEDRLLHNGVTCPARTLARQSSKDGSGPAMVILGPLSNTGIIPVSVSTMTVKFPAMDSEVLKKKRKKKGTLDLPLLKTTKVV